MAHKDKIFRDAAYGEDVDPRGIEKTKILKSDAYYEDANHPERTADPLAKNAKAANKPGSSIPSIFGRMMFFKTALKNARISNFGGINISVYDKLVSQWLDLMEGIFNRSYNYTFTVWNKDDQLEKLGRTHKVLHDALKGQMDKYFEDHVNNIYIIKNAKTGEIVGATSPYTVVFTSPNYEKDRPADIVPLINRKKGFRIYMYNLYKALSSQIVKKVAVKKVGDHGEEEIENPSWKMVNDLCKYLERNFNSEEDSIKEEVLAYGIDTVGQLTENYSPIMCNENGIEKEIDIVNLDSLTLDTTGNTVPISVGDLKLFARKKSEIESDFFVDSDNGKLTTDAIRPLILPNVNIDNKRTAPAYSTMRYIDDIYWKADVLRGELYKIENLSEQELELPGGDGVRYVWLSASSMLEEKLIKLPYKMDDTKFEDVINVKGNSYLLPIKPKIFKYFNLETVLNGRHGQGKGFSWHYDESNNKIVCRLDIPVSNRNGSKSTYVTLEKVYSLPEDFSDNQEDTVSASPLMGYPVSVGITPFIRLNNVADNRYDVLLHHGELKNEGVQDIRLEFYEDSEHELSANVRTFPKIQASTTVMQSLYKILGSTFKTIRMTYDCGKEDPVSGMIIPKFNVPSELNHRVFYAIDFGTTNTHIAYTVDGVNSISFNTDELKNQVVYLAKKENIKNREDFLSQHTQNELENACFRIYGDQSLATQEEQARRFFPNFELNQFAFPIRTAAYGSTKENQELFDGYAIGFNYPHEKEKVFLDFYNTKLKWNLERNDPDADRQAKLFFKELLLIIRTHWLSIDNVDLNEKPHLALTFPLAMQSDALFNLWVESYAETFGVSIEDASNNYIIEVSESLAPAHKMMSSGNYAVSGLLNVDIGGGTTDIQYYRQEKGRTYAFYNSERFAGDDLWGCGRENMNFETNIKENVFTRYADVVMRDRTIRIGTTGIEYEKLKDLEGKEKIGRLLRDTSNTNFATQVSKNPDFGRNTPALKVVFLHYAAIIFHIAKWSLGHPNMKQKFPEKINFSGFGSKYIQIMFGRNNAELTEYTKELLKEYGIEDVENLSVEFTNDNPKGVTAEGASIYAWNKIGNKTVVKPVRVDYYGYDGSDRKKSPTYSEASNTEIEEAVMASFDEYLSGFCNVQERCNLEIPSLTPAEKKKFRTAAGNGYEQIVNDFLSGTANLKDIRVLQSLFFWTLKDALYNFDQFDN